MVTSKGTPIPYTNLKLNSYPNTQLDLFCSDNLLFNARLPVCDSSIDVRILVCDLITNLRKMLAAKFFSSSYDEDHEAPWSQNLKVYKHSSFFKRKMN